MTDVFVQFTYVNSDMAGFKHATLNLVCHVPSASIRKSLQQSCQHIQNEVQRAKLATAINKEKTKLYCHTITSNSIIRFIDI